MDIDKTKTICETLVMILGREKLEELQSMGIKDESERLYHNLVDFLTELSMLSTAAGLEVYYTGDMANPDGFGQVAWTSVAGDSLVKLDDGREFRIKRSDIGSKYEGNCSVRFVTRTAYNEYREARLKSY